MAELATLAGMAFALFLVWVFIIPHDEDSF